MSTSIVVYHASEERYYPNPVDVELWEDLSKTEGVREVGLADVLTKGRVSFVINVADEYVDRVRSKLAEKGFTFGETQSMGW